MAATGRRAWRRRQSLNAAADYTLPMAVVGSATDPACPVVCPFAHTGPLKATSAHTVPEHLSKRVAGAPVKKQVTVLVSSGHSYDLEFNNVYVEHTMLHILHSILVVTVATQHQHIILCDITVAVASFMCNINTNKM